MLRVAGGSFSCNVDCIGAHAKSQRLNDSQKRQWCPGWESNPHEEKSPEDFKSSASAIPPPGPRAEIKHNIIQEFASARRGASVALEMATIRRANMARRIVARIKTRSGIRNKDVVRVANCARCRRWSHYPLRSDEHTAE